MAASDGATHLVLIPCFNSGAKLGETVRAAMARWPHVLVVDDGSNDGAPQTLAASLAGNDGCRLVRRDVNGGKGAAVLDGMRAALAEGFSHALVMDADGQHPAELIPDFIRISMNNPGALVLGEPVFGPDAPRERVHGRRVGNWWANLATLWAGIHDSLFGFRVYPIRPSVDILGRIRTARGFDFDTEIAVRLVWDGVRPLNYPARVAYPSSGEGGTTHFRYLRDNLLLIGTHTRLFFGMLPRIPVLLRRKREWKEAP